jgi:hypothetical protein
MHFRTRSSFYCRLIPMLAGIWLLATCAGAIAQAQESDLAPRDDFATAEAGEPQSKGKRPPPDIDGTWCGSVDDSHLGSGMIRVAVTQRGAKLTGTWTADFAGSGTLKGKIKGNVINLTLRQTGNPCRVAANGTLVQPGEITGNYTIFGCHQSDGGTLDITSPDC